MPVLGPVRDGPAGACAPWVVAFAFGLLHGLGFASALIGSIAMLWVIERISDVAIY